MNNILKKYITRLLFLIIITLFILIFLRSNEKFYNDFYEYVYNKNFSFAIVNNWYKDKFGSPLPFESLFIDSEPVFNEKLKYNSIEKYKDGVKLDVDFAYLIPSLDNGIIIFIGEKEGYGKTVIVQQENGIDVWYANISEVNVKLYDYVVKGSLIGSVNENLYLVFIKDGEVVNYENYI